MLTSRSNRRLVPLTEKLTVNFLLLGGGCMLILAVYIYRTGRNNLIESTGRELEEELRMGMDFFQWKVSRLANDAIKAKETNAEPAGIHSRMLELGFVGFVQPDENAILRETESTSDIKPILYDSDSIILRGSTRKNDDWALVYLGKKNSGDKFGIATHTNQNHASTLVLSDSLVQTLLPEPGNGMCFLILSSRGYAVLKTSTLCNAIDTLKGMRFDIKPVSLLNSSGQQYYLQAGLPLPGSDPGWKIFILKDAAKVQEAISEMFLNLVWITLILSLGLFLFIYVTVRRAVRPLIVLTEANRRTGLGNYVPVEERISNDEIGELTRSFNQMTSRLKTQQEEIVKERYRRLKAMIDSQELERKRVSKELHEGIAQELAALKFALSALVNDFPDKDRIHQLEGLADTMIDQLRQISNNLSPFVLAEFGLGPALTCMAEDMEKETGIRILMDTSGLPARITGKWKTYVFRIVQESMYNSARHSGADTIRCSFRSGYESLQISLSDNGKSFTQAEIQNAGYGLYTMKERIELLKGKLRVESETGKGTLVEIEIPFVSGNSQ